MTTSSSGSCAEEIGAINVAVRPTIPPIASLMAFASGEFVFTIYPLIA
jgi:hypothetical protein